MQKIIMSKLLTIYKKHYPQLVDAFMEEYCSVADQPGTDKMYFYGHGSFKWMLHQMKEINDSQIKEIFYGILCEYNLDILSEHDVQFKIQKSYFLRQYREQLNQWPSTPDIKAMETFTAGDFTFTINNTTHNLASRIFRYTKSDGIIYVNPETKEAAVNLRVNSTVNNLEGFKNYLLDVLTKLEDGWSISGEHKNRIINYGLIYKTPTSVTTDQLKEIIQNYF